MAESVNEREKDELLYGTEHRAGDRNPSFL